MRWLVPIGITAAALVAIALAGALFGFGLEAGKWVAQQTLTDTRKARARMRYEECLLEHASKQFFAFSPEQECKGILAVMQRQEVK